MKLVSYTITHYSGGYLPYCLKQIEQFVDVSGVFYTSNPSHNHSTNLTCPETKNDILNSIKKMKKVHFVDASGFTYEGQHRDYALNYMKEIHKPDFVLVMDSDEIWPTQTLQNVIEFLESLPDEQKRQDWLINFSHLWRSFNHIIHDDMWPVRLIDCSQHDRTVGYIPRELGDIYHMGYAIPTKLLIYKSSIHGHKNEFRKYWFEQKWKNWKHGIDDVHPTCDNTWYPEPFDKYQLPEIMHEHPYFNLDMIE